MSNMQTVALQYNVIYRDLTFMDVLHYHSHWRGLDEELVEAF